MEEFFNSSEQTVQKSESKRSENVVYMQLKQRSVDRPVDRHAQFSAHLGRPTSTSQVSI